MNSPGVSEAADEHEGTVSGEDADVVTHSEAHGTPRRRGRLSLRIPREARVGIAVSLSFGLLATVMVLNRPAKDKGSSRTPPNLTIANTEGDGGTSAGNPDDAKGQGSNGSGASGAGEAGTTPTGGGEHGSPGRSSGEPPTGVASSTPKQDGPEKLPDLPPGARKPKPETDQDQHTAAKAVDTPALPPSGENSAPPKPVEVTALPPSGENSPAPKPMEPAALPPSGETASPPKPVEPTNVAETPKSPLTAGGDGQSAPAPVAGGPPVESKEPALVGTAPLPAFPAVSVADPAEQPNVPAAVSLPPPADTGSGPAAPAPGEGGLGPNVSAPSAVEPPPSSAGPLPAETSTPTATPTPVVQEATPASPAVMPPVGSKPDGTAPTPPAANEPAPVTAPSVPQPSEVQAAPPASSQPAPPTVAPAEPAVMPSSGNSGQAPGDETWVKLPNTRFHHDADDRPAAPVTRAETAPEPAAARPGREPNDRIEPIPHVVQPGENFWTISRLYYRSGRYYRALWAANRDRVPVIDKLYVGTTIRIPPHEALDPALIGAPAPQGGEGTSAAMVPLHRTSRPVVGEGSRPARTVSRVDDREKVTLPTRDVVGDVFPRGRPIDEVDDEEPESDVERPRRPRYRVRTPYETIRSIAKATLGDAHREGEILRLNRKVIKDPYHLTPGQYLELPEDALIGGATR